MLGSFARANMTTTLSHKVCRGCGMNYSPDGPIGSQIWRAAVFCHTDCWSKSLHHLTRTFEWRVWQGVKERCTCPSHSAYARYGGRGIRVCARWAKSFPTFLQDMGKAPSEDHTIERVNVHGHYEPSNCVWLHHSKQGLNKSTTLKVRYKGVERVLIEVCRELSFPYARAKYRMKRGMSGDEIFDPVLLTTGRAKAAA